MIENNLTCIVILKACFPRAIFTWINFCSISITIVSDTSTVRGMGNAGSATARAGSHPSLPEFYFASTLISCRKLTATCPHNSIGKLEFLISSSCCIFLCCLVLLRWSKTLLEVTEFIFIGTGIIGVVITSVSMIKKHAVIRIYTLSKAVRVPEGDLLIQYSQRMFKKFMAMMV